MEKKYILTDDVIDFNSHTLHRIKAVRDFDCVKAGDLGGFIESEKNLDHDGDAWVSGDAKVFDNAKVSGDARVFDNAKVSDDARVFGYAKVFGDVWVSGDAWVSDNAKASDDARVFGDAKVFGDARVFGYARVFGDAWVFDYACVSGDAKVFDNAKLSGDAWVSDDAWVFGCACVSGDACVTGNAWVHAPFDIALIKGFGSKFRATSFFRCVDGLVRCQCGCFCGTVDEFRSKVRETHGNSKYAKEYLMIADLMELHFKED